MYKDRSRIGAFGKTPLNMIVNRENDAKPLENTLENMHAKKEGQIYII